MARVDYVAPPPPPPPPPPENGGLGGGYIPPPPPHTHFFRRLCLFLYACAFVLILVETSEIKTTLQVSQENRAQTDNGHPL